MLTPSGVVLPVSASGDPLSRRSLLALLSVHDGNVLFAAEPWVDSPPELPPVLTKAVDVEVIALNPVMALTGPGAF